MHANRLMQNVYRKKFSAFTIKYTDGGRKKEDAAHDK